jgi:hypothetical protein
MSIFHLLFAIYTTLPTTMSPICGVYLLLRGLTIISLLVISTVPISEAYMTPLARYVPWPLGKKINTSYSLLMRQWARQE